jgi:hypothetical protein
MQRRICGSRIGFDLVIEELYPLQFPASAATLPPAQLLGLTARYRASLRKVLARRVLNSRTSHSN